MIKPKRFVLTLSDQGGFVAYDPATGTVSQGETKDEATKNLLEAVELFHEESFDGAA